MKRKAFLLLLLFYPILSFTVLGQEHGLLFETKLVGNAGGNHANSVNISFKDDNGSSSIVSYSPENFGFDINSDPIFHFFSVLNSSSNPQIDIRSRFIGNPSNPETCVEEKAFPYTLDPTGVNNINNFNVDPTRSFNRCNFRTYIYTIHIDFPVDNNGQVVREICPEEEITLNYGYHWQFSLNGIDWNHFPDSKNGRTTTFNLLELLNLTNTPESALQNANKAHFRTGYKPTLEFTNIISFDIKNCSPELDGAIVDIQPSCNNSINVANNDNGSFTVTFDRELDDTKQEKMKIEVWDLVNGIWDGFESKVIEKIDFNGRSYTWNPRNLPGGTYKLFWQTKSNNAPFDNANSTPDKFGESPSFVLNTPPLLSVSGVPTDVQCAGGSDGSITVTPNGGTPGISPAYEYSIDDGINWQTSALFDGLTKGDYVVTIRDGNSCEVQSPTISVDERFPTIPNVIGLPGLITNPTLIDGNNGRIVIAVSGGSGNYTNYVWTKDGNPFTPPIGSTNTSIVDLYEGVYTIIVTDSNGCNSEIETFTLTDPEPIDITINMTPDTLDCSDTMVNLIASATGGYLDPDGEYSYLWNDGTTNPSLNNVGIGTYQVTVTDNGGNSQVQEINVEGPNLITVTLSNKKELSCRDGSDAGIQLDIQGGTGDYVVIWEKIAAPDFSAFGTTLENIAHGAYIYRVVDENGCMVTNASQPIEFANPPLFTIDLGEDPFFCEGQTVTISAAISDPQATYSWTSTTGFTSTNPEITVDQEGQYTVTVTSGKGCIAEDTINVIENIKEIKAEFLYTSQIFTNEKMVMIDVTYPAPNEVEWIIPDAAEVISQNQDLAELSFDTPGEYEITLIATLGDCKDVYIQKVLVLQQEGLNNENDPTIQQLENIKEFKAYPNPSDGQFSVKITLKEEKEISIKVFNLTDNTLLKHISATGKKEYDIPFTLQVASGVYAIVLETPYGNAIRKVIIK
ncbi:T9SS type A sorting domain-containing protein [Aquimarina sp. 2201CG1-2-11]|uniref:T9SS type A sorting domain-containing protein n=1 Tax=Aquimarina discodermiae TaxID=3231043 RepID=UPI0034637383